MYTGDDGYKLQSHKDSHDSDKVESTVVLKSVDPKAAEVVGGGGTSLAVVVVWLSKDAWFAIVDTFLLDLNRS